MSFWFRRKDAKDRTYYLSISFPLLYCVAVFGILIALLLPVIGWLRGFFP